VRCILLLLSLPPSSSLVMTEEKRILFLLFVGDRWSMKVKQDSSLQS
jgi:hypothetical protein